MAEALADVTELAQQEIFITGERAGGNEDEVDIVKFDPVHRKEDVLGFLQHKEYKENRTAVGFADNRVFLVGGGPPTNRVSSFNLASRRSQTVAWMNEKREFCAVASSPHELVVCGGADYSGHITWSCEVLHVARNEWHELPDMQEGRWCFQVLWFHTGHIFAIGGESEGQFLESVELLKRRWDGTNVSTEEWCFVAPMLNMRRDFGAAAFQERIFVAGGNDHHYALLNSAELFSPANEFGQWTQLQPMQTAMEILSGVMFNGVVFMFGESSANKIQRLTLTSIGKSESWVWDEVDAIQSVKRCIRVTSSK